MVRLGTEERLRAAVPRWHVAVQCASRLWGYLPAGFPPFLGSEAAWISVLVLLMTWTFPMTSRSRSSWPRDLRSLVMEEPLRASST